MGGAGVVKCRRALHDDGKCATDALDSSDKPGQEWLGCLWIGFISTWAGEIVWCACLCELDEELHGNIPVMLTTPMSFKNLVWMT